jgi:hypothetical protein
LGTGGSYCWCNVGNVTGVNEFGLHAGCTTIPRSRPRLPQLSQSARSSIDAAMLEDIAAELDEEADKIDAAEVDEPESEE